MDSKRNAGLYFAQRVRQELQTKTTKTKGPPNLDAGLYQFCPKSCTIQPWNHSKLLVPANNVYISKVEIKRC